MASDSPQFIYKILPRAPAEPLPAQLPLSELDAKDGFVHLSTADQVCKFTSLIHPMHNFSYCELRAPWKNLLTLSRFPRRQVCSLLSTLSSGSPNWSWPSWPILSSLRTASPTSTATLAPGTLTRYLALSASKIRHGPIAWVLRLGLSSQPFIALSPLHYSTSTCIDRDTTEQTSIALF